MPIRNTYACFKVCIHIGEGPMILQELWSDNSAAKRPSKNFSSLISFNIPCWLPDMPR